MYLKKEQTLMHLSKKGGRTKLVGNDFAQNWPKITPNNNTKWTDKMGLSEKIGIVSRRRFFRYKKLHLIC